jgi:hypothetical protein
MGHPSFVTGRERQVCEKFMLTLASLFSLSRNSPNIIVAR